MKRIYETHFRDGEIQVCFDYEDLELMVGVEHDGNTYASIDGEAGPTEILYFLTKAERNEVMFIFFDMFKFLCDIAPKFNIKRLTVYSATDSEINKYLTNGDSFETYTRRLMVYCKRLGFDFLTLSKELV